MPTRARSLLLFLLFLPGCVAPKPSADLLAPTEKQTQLRACQSRTLDTTDRPATLRAVLAVLQDLGFLIERANEPMGWVTAARFAEPDYGNIVGITVTVRTQADGRILVRANAVFNNRPVEDPEVYQNFFTALERALFQTKD